MRLNRYEGNEVINDRLDSDLAQSEKRRDELQGLVKDGVHDGVKFREELDKKV